MFNLFRSSRQNQLRYVRPCLEALGEGGSPRSAPAFLDEAAARDLTPLEQRENGASMMLFLARRRIICMSIYATLLCALPLRAIAQGDRKSIMAQASLREDSARDPERILLGTSGIGTDKHKLLRLVNEIANKDTELVRAGAYVRQLGAGSFAVRDAAHRRLLALGAAALPALRAALRDSNVAADLESSWRIAKCMRQIEDDYSWADQRAAVRILLRGPPEETVLATLLRFLPYTPDQTSQEDIWFGAHDWLARQPILRGSLRSFLTDPLSARRALASFLLARHGDEEHRKSARLLLSDADAHVRLRVAQGLLATGDEAGVPALIELLNEDAVEISWSAEELLVWVAGQKSPAEVIGVGSADRRRRCYKAWREWWALNREDVSRGFDERISGPLLLLVKDRGNAIGNPGPLWFRRLWLCGCDGRPRWALEGECISNARLLPGNRLLIVNDRSAANKDYTNEHNDIAIQDLSGAIVTKLTGRTGPRLEILPNGHICFGGSARIKADMLQHKGVKALGDHAWIPSAFLREKPHDVEYVQNLVWFSVVPRFRNGNVLRGGYWAERQHSDSRITYKLAGFDRLAELRSDGEPVWEAPCEGFGVGQIILELVRLGFDQESRSKAR
jgi:HEAT repeat protein